MRKVPVRRGQQEKEMEGPSVYRNTGKFTAVN
jgi:hypothetical protein